jgi:hypothetical protein
VIQDYDKNKVEHSQVASSNAPYIKNRLICSLADPSLFIFHSEHSLLMLLLYIDDLLLTRSIEALVSNFIQLLSGEFTMKH